MVEYKEMKFCEQLGAQIMLGETVFL